jgi:hypothetical protein
LLALLLFSELFNLESDGKIKKPPASALAADDHDLGNWASSRPAAPRQWIHMDNRDKCCSLWFARKLTQEKHTRVVMVAQAVSLRRRMPRANIRNGIAT